MFGQQNNDDDNGQPINDVNPASAPIPEPVADGSLGVPDDTNGTSTTTDTTPSLPAFSPPSPAFSPDLSTTTGDNSNASTPAGSGNGDELLDIKQQALQQLSPLVSHLEQTPEEKFRTTMMMIQASDNQDLVSEAFEAAKQITDDKARAQALLDVINEINYFTQQHSNS